jgi:hypothetical protein
MIGISIILMSLKKIARMIARISDVQKLKQKSQSNNREISLGALVIISSRTPSFPISKIANAAAKVIYIKAESIVIKYTVDIIL